MLLWIVNQSVEKGDNLELHPVPSFATPVCLINQMCNQRFIFLYQISIDSHPPDCDDVLSLAERIIRMVGRRINKRYRDILPQPEPPMDCKCYHTRSYVISISDNINTALPAFPYPPTPYKGHASSVQRKSLRSRILPVFRTPRNIFGLPHSHH